MTDFKFAGKTFEVRMDNGVVFHNTYAAEGNKLHYAAIDGAAEGASEDVELHVGVVAAGIYLVGWNEVSGKAVAHVMDFNTGTITGYWSFDAGGGRIGEVHAAKFKEVR